MSVPLGLGGICLGAWRIGRRIRERGRAEEARAVLSELLGDPGLAVAPARGISEFELDGAFGPGLAAGIVAAGTDGFTVYNGTIRDFSGAGIVTGFGTKILRTTIFANGAGIFAGPAPSNCLRATYIADITIPDGMVLEAGQVLVPRLLALLRGILKNLPPT